MQSDAVTLLNAGVYIGAVDFKCLQLSSCFDQSVILKMIPQGLPLSPVDSIGDPL